MDTEISKRNCQTMLMFWQ